MPQLSRTFALAGAAALAAFGAVLARRHRTGPLSLPVEEPPVRTGAPHDRGRVDALGVDVAALRDTRSHEPVVQYLTYLQTRRGEDGHLMFVRHDDLDALAGREGLPVETFLERLEQLGVVVSNN